ncbi:MAG TPA: efflux RND transporter periplasmic adaptor subunit [Flavobacteriaceae bacterium]|nr:efflux RND transporter periplasmic adaptor subunit [Flavobacteriaceae bacterium]
MKKNILYLVIAVIVGLGAGWLIFGNSSDTSVNKDVSEMSDHDHAGEPANQMWTCSMHPQIMQPAAGDCPICGMDLIPAESGSDGLLAGQFKLTENAMALANIQTTVVGKGNAEGNTIKLSGKIAENEEANAVQVSYFSGRIEHLNVSFTGEEVHKGQLLATIYSPELYAAQQELITAASLKESQPALYKAVRNKLKLWKLSENQINQIEETQKVKENFPVYATVSGTVSEVMAAQGDYVNQGQPIVKLSNLNSVWAEFDAYESQIAQFKVGQKIKITTNAYPNKEFEGTISFIDPILNNATRTVTVRATLPNRDNLFKPGMFVTAKVKGTTQTMENTLTVPASAVLWTGERSLVYVKTNPNEPVFEMREVTLGNRTGETYQVSTGLNSGEEIVTNGTFTVDAAAQLQGKKSMMNQQKIQNESATMNNMKMSFSNVFSTDFNEAIQSYLKMKDAFVASNASQVSTLAKATSEKLKAISTDDLGKMENQHLQKSIEMLDAIANNVILENQRSHFVILNENILPIAMNIENSINYYVQKCPMANNNKGAVWLSTEEEIKNPYYGDAMLTCGSVIDTIR